MVNGFRRGQKPYIKLKQGMETIRWIFEQIDVPEWWYSFDVPRDNTLCFVLERDGIHTFIPERGEKKGELVFKSWYDAINDAAQSFEPRYTKAIIQASNLVRTEEMRTRIMEAAIRRVKQRQRMKNRSMQRKKHMRTKEKAKA